MINAYSDIATNSITTDDWVRATKDLTISAYNPVPTEKAGLEERNNYVFLIGEDKGDSTSNPNAI
jgi:hypothetical protein